MKLLNNENIEYIYVYGYKTLVVSYCYENMTNDVIDSQLSVFNKLNLKINQFKGNLRHSEFMDYILVNYESDFYIFFDIDCIPMKDKIYEIIIQRIGFKSLIGIEQQCNCNSSINHVYAGPACFGISKKFYNEINKISFKETNRSDVAEELSYICEEMNKDFFVFEKTYSENNIWKLGENGYFGHGTTYDDDLLYHQFEIIKNKEKFINKCNRFINE